MDYCLYEDHQVKPVATIDSNTLSHVSLIFRHTLENEEAQQAVRGQPPSASFLEFGSPVGGASTFTFGKYECEHKDRVGVVRGSPALSMHDRHGYA
jgi:hypothetical protein